MIMVRGRLIIASLLGIVLLLSGVFGECNDMLCHLYKKQDKMQDEMAKILEKMQNEMAGMRDKMQEEIAGMRDKMREEMAGMRDKLQEEMAGTRDKIQEEMAGTSDKIQEEMAGTRDEMLEGMAGIRVNMQEKMSGMQVELAGMREKINSQEQIHKLKIERIEEIIDPQDNKVPTVVKHGFNNESSIALAVLQLSSTLEKQLTSKTLQLQDITEKMSRLIAPTSQASETNMSHVTTAIDILNSGYNEIRTTVEDLEVKVLYLLAYDVISNQELAIRGNTTNVHKGLDQFRHMVADSRKLGLTSNKGTYNNIRKPRYCQDIYILGERQDGVFNIYPGWNMSQSVRVWCEFDVGHEIGWTRILARMPTEEPVNFTRGWDEYKDGFGDAHNEYWIGLSVLHEMMLAHCRQVLQVSLHSWDQKSRHAQYKDFSIGNEESGFKLSVGGYTGDAGDALAYINNGKFTTIDKDNDSHGSSNCAAMSSSGGGDGGGFWYNSCGHTFPTRELRKRSDGIGMTWIKWSNSFNLKKIIFRISPRLPSM